MEPLDQWNFTRDGRYGDWYWNPLAKDIPAARLGEDARLRPDEYICMINRRPIDRLGLIKFVRANLSEKDWDAFVEIYGIPGVFVIGPEQVPEEKRDEYKEAAEAAAAGGSGYLPYGSTVQTANEARGIQPFAARLEWLSKKLVLAGTGGMLTMLAESGSGTLAGGAHSETFAAIARARAARISEIFQRSIDKETLDAAFEGKPRLAYFDLAAEEERDVGEIVDHAVKIRAALPGHQIDPEDLAERTGYRIIPAPALPAPLPAYPATEAAHRRTSMHSEGGLLSGEREATVETLAARREERLMQASREALAKAMAADLTPVRARIEAALALEDDQAMLDELSRLDAELPALLVEICKSPQAEQALEESLTAALFNGLGEGAAKRNTTTEDAQ
jgi:phage gp29-like protein